MEEIIILIVCSLAFVYVGVKTFLYYFGKDFYGISEYRWNKLIDHIEKAEKVTGRKPYMCISKNKIPYEASSLTCPMFLLFGLSLVSVMIYKKKDVYWWKTLKTNQIEKVLYALYKIYKKEKSYEQRKI